MKRTSLSFLCCLLFVNFLQAKTSAPPPLICPNKIETKGTWLPNLRHQRKGIALVLHGLNTKPEKMLTLGKLMTTLGYQSFVAALPRHRESKKDDHLITYDDHFRSTQQLLCLIDKTKKENDKVVFVAHSMGGIMLLHHQIKRKLPFQIDHQVFLATPLAVKWYSNLVLGLGKLAPALALPSLAPSGYRARSGSHLKQYGTLGKLIDELHVLPEKSQIKKIPTHFFFSLEDEVVDSKDSIEVVKKMGSQWSFQLVNKESSEISYHHLFIDKESAGDAWKGLLGWFEKNL